jgi:hypothetical protein
MKLPCFEQRELQLRGLVQQRMLLESPTLELASLLDQQEFGLLVLLQESLQESEVREYSQKVPPFLVILERVVMILERIAMVLERAALILERVVMVLKSVAHSVGPTELLLLEVQL